MQVKPNRIQANWTTRPWSKGADFQGSGRYRPTAAQVLYRVKILAGGTLYMAWAITAKGSGPVLDDLYKKVLASKSAKVEVLDYATCAVYGTFRMRETGLFEATMSHTPAWTSTADSFPECNKF